MKQKLLIIDDDRNSIDALLRALSGQEMDVSMAGEAVKALELARQRSPQVVIVGIAMTGVNGESLTMQLRQSNPGLQVILTGSREAFDQTIGTFKVGGFDFIPRPFERCEVISAVHRAFEKSMLQQENALLRERLKVNPAPDFEWGKSRAFKGVMDRAAHAAFGDSAILIVGEAGNGKKVLARHIWSVSPRAHRPFIHVNCAAVSESMLEAELFGNRKGAFTGVWQDKKGKVREAEGGTLFLDEVGVIPLCLQPRLLRILQGGEFDPSGGGQERVDVRLIAATSKNLRKEVEAGRFREDLFHRLNLNPLFIPPLRQRPEDLRSLILFFISKYCRKTKKPNLSVSADALRFMEGYAWPGNIRELENVVERAVILCLSHQITTQDLPVELTSASDGISPLYIGQGMTLEEIEMTVIQNALKRNQGDKAKTAEDLGISLRTVYRKLDAFSARHPPSAANGARLDRIHRI